MRCTRLFCAIGVSLWSVAVTCAQAPPATELSETLRTHLRDESYEIITSVRGLPLGVRDGLQKLFASPDLDIAEPGAESQVSDPTPNPKPASRRLVAAGCSRDFHCLVYYERFGSPRTWQVALFHWTPTATRFEGGGSAPSGLTTIDEVRKAVVSGAIKSPNKVW